jgi:pyruvate,water dikinase
MTGMRRCKRNGRHVGICGQAPSDYPEVARYLVEQGIDSISLNPDSVLATVRNRVEVERQLGIEPRPSGGAG